MHRKDRSADISQLAFCHREKGGVPFVVAGAEGGSVPSRFGAGFLIFTQTMPSPIYAEVADGLDSIRSTLMDGPSLRLGHGVRIAEGIRDLGAESASTAGLDEVARGILNMRYLWRPALHRTRKPEPLGHGRAQITFPVEEICRRRFPNTIG